MGLKVKAGLALGGMLLSWAFGLNFLSGVATYLDSTGNILVDIADGIGLISKGIEALENYLDPADHTPTEAGTSSSGGPSVHGPDPLPTPAVISQQHHPVICKKGKCARYDPTKDRVLQQKLIQAERERILQQVRQGEISADKILVSDFNVDDDDDDLEERGLKSKRVKRRGPDESRRVEAPRSKAGSSVTSDIKEEAAFAEPIADSDSLEGPDEKPSGLTLDTIAQSPNATEVTGWKLGLRRLLSSSTDLLHKLKTLLLRVVIKVFPWNRRAQRRLQGDADDEEL